MCKCKNCEMLNTGEPIKVVDIEIGFGRDVFHFEDGYKCLYNGRESLDIEELQKGKCRIR